MDLVDPLPVSRENRFILTMRDRGSGFLIATPIVTKHFATVLERIEEHFIAKFGVPREVVTDNAKEFCSNILKAFTEDLGMKHKYSTAYHP